MLLNHFTDNKKPNAINLSLNNSFDQLNKFIDQDNH